MLRNIPIMRYATKKQRLRHRLLNEWRGAEGEALNPQSEVAIGALIPNILKIWKLDERLKGDEVAAAWRELAGDFAAKFTAPDGIKRGVLTVRVSQPAIHHTLMMKKAEILARLQERFGKSEVKDLRFRVG